MKTAARVEYRYLYARLIKAMSVDEAKGVLGFPPTANPSPVEINKAWRQKAFENHPDRGGDPTKMVEINVAKDVLEGRSQPTYEPPSGGGGYSGPSYSGPKWEPPPDEEIVSFDEAKGQGGIPGGVEWLFVTDYHSSGYSSDEFTNRATGWVAVGQTDKSWVFTTVENYWREDHFIGTKRGKTDKWMISTHQVPKGQPVTARFFYGEVMKAWKRFTEMTKKFNSKVTPAEGWTFGRTPPKGRSLSIKNYLFNSGMMAEEEAGKPRKYKIEVQNKGLPFDQRDNPPSDYFKPRYGDPFKLVLIINGKEYDLSRAATEKLYKLRVKGKDFMEWMFGQYHYGGEVKVLTLKREGKEVMGWMAENLPGLAPWVVEALKAASVQKPASRSRRRYGEDVSDRVGYRYMYARLFQAMSLDRAKEVLGLPLTGMPSKSDVMRAWRQKAFENHPDRGGDPTKMVEVNVAKDVLTGLQRPTWDEPTPPPSPAPPEPEPDPVPPPRYEAASFDEAAKGKTSNVYWMWVTGYVNFEPPTPDDRREGALDTGWVAYGRSRDNNNHVFLPIGTGQYWAGDERETWWVGEPVVIQRKVPTKKAIQMGLKQAIQRIPDGGSSIKPNKIFGFGFGGRRYLRQQQDLENPSWAPTTIQQWLDDTGLDKEKPLKAFVELRTGRSGQWDRLVVVTINGRENVFSPKGRQDFERTLGPKIFKKGTLEWWEPTKKDLMRMKNTEWVLTQLWKGFYDEFDRDSIEDIKNFLKSTGAMY